MEGETYPNRESEIEDVPTPEQLRAQRKADDKTRLHAYSLLGIDPLRVASEPVISHVLARLPNGVMSAIEYLYGSDSEEARKFVTFYNDLRRNPKLFDLDVRGIIPFEAYCVKLDIPSKRMLEIITGECFVQSGNVGSILAASAHPAIVEFTITAAHDIQYGFRDRQLLHQHAGFTPIPKTTIIARGGVQNNSTTSIQAKISVNELPAMEARMSRIADRFNERMLGDGKENDSNKRLIEAEVIKEEEDEHVEGN